MTRTHPRGLYLLFTVEMWERFSYYGMRAIFVLYMTKFLKFDTMEAGSAYGWYTGLVYFTPLVGGYLADRYLGQRRSIVAGSILMALGEFALATLDRGLFYVGLGLLIAGNGLFKPNIATIVGKLYGENDPRRDGGFTIFYMGCNLGSFFAPLVCGWLGEEVGWQYGFAAAGVGMTIGLVTYLLGHRKLLGDVGREPARRGVHAAEPAAPLTRVEKERIAVICVLVFFTVFFWSAYEQAGSSLTLFAERETDRTVPALGVELPASSFQAVNPLLIFVLAPLFSLLWLKLAERKLEPSTPAKFVLGLACLSLGFVIMAGAAYRYAAAGPVSPLWLVGAYLLCTVGELCLSPIGLSMVSKLAPVRFASLFMGTWFLANFAANFVAGNFAGYYDTIDHTVFHAVLVASSGGAALILLCLVKPLKRWMHGVA